MKSKIQHYQAGQEYFFIEGCFINELSNNVEDPELSVARARVEPGVTTQWHYLVNTTERYVILEGSGVVEIGNLLPQEVNIGDVVIIPRNTRQRISNTGAKDLVFLALCTPRFKAENYKADLT
ncbi:cupin domain-containing protein [Methylophaga pinxianii]|uniref:cupin domain-containing protein n=1 Tax=Methylophaga pinxianii TaxID=2881052 RepID=UPI001CF199A6|nr:cupin domain-containing protein [Methylophaga pinxianii]MCB2426246.1 cupin domain-containing protein [Methylophaga pinxianii]UPH46282.1 cupin domain-containing protein [Methylophaga pinxianii]